MNSFLTRLSFAALAFSVAAGAIAQGDPATVQRIVDEGKNHSQVMKTLKGLTSIGPRLTSSTYLDRAEKWCMDRFKSWGLKNVHLEKWGEYPVGFDRGKRQVGRMIAPFEAKMEFTTPSWTPGTKGLVRAEAILVPATMDDFNKVKGQLKDKWLIVPTGSATPRRGENNEPTELEKAIQASGMKGRVFAARNDLVITSGRQTITWETRPKDVRVIVRRSDMDRITRNLERGPVVLEFDLENKWVKGPRPQYNVVAEIPGTEKPDEVVIVSGHLDSWDGPGSQGALDNGTGSSTAMEAARILMKAGAKPKRTIRFVLWTGEEQGLFGSTEYVKQHEAELPKISAVLVDDGGTNYQGGYVGIASQKDMFETAFAPVVSAFPDMPMKFEVRDRMPRGGGSDHAPFNRAGVPGFFTTETGRSDYTFVHHTQHDRYEKAIPEYLVQSSVCHAVVSYNLACADSLVARQAPEPAAPAATPATPPTTTGGGTGGGR